MAKEWVVDVTELAESLASSFKLGPMTDALGRRMLTEETIARVGNLKIQIFSKEHPPPHFRVSYAGETANFAIKDCEKLNGGLDKWTHNITLWHAANKSKLIERWNATRSSDCPVGAYRE